MDITITFNFIYFQDHHAPKTQNKERELPSTEITVANVTKDSSSTEPVSASKDDMETSEKMWAR